MIEIYCVIEDPAEDDFVCLLRKNEAGAWGGLSLPDSAILSSAVEEAVGAEVTHVWPLCDRLQEEPPPRTGDRREPVRAERTRLGAMVGSGSLALDGGEWAVVPFDDACDMVPADERRVLTLARQGAWIHKVALVEPAQ
jgi:hypothetical protein